jgi:hypothetical protein
MLIIFYEVDNKVHYDDRNSHHTTNRHSANSNNHMTDSSTNSKDTMHVDKGEELFNKVKVII